MDYNKENLPKHIAIIMDGNRRWAKSKGLPVPLGHKKGAETLEDIAKYANRIGIEYMTVYAFSTENWKRTQEEVSALMLLFQTYIDKYAKLAQSENIKMKFLGDLDGFTPKLKNGFLEKEEITKNNTGLKLNIAINYGGRDELVKAVQKISSKVQSG